MISKKVTELRDAVVDTMYDLYSATMTLDCQLKANKDNATITNLTYEMLRTAMSSVSNTIEELFAAFLYDVCDCRQVGDDEFKKVTDDTDEGDEMEWLKVN